MKIDKTETERLFRSHYAAMYRLARGILRDDEEARDAVSDVFAGLLDRERPAEVADGGLTPRTRDIIRMRFDEQLNCRDIAESCGISLAAVYKHIAQGIEKLKEKFNR